MASTACFLHHHALSTAAASSRTHGLVPTVRPVVRAQAKQGDTVKESATAVSRRVALTVLVGTAAVGTKVSPADAAYGEAANVFGKPKTNTDFLPYEGDGFKVLIPSKWNPSKEVEYPGQVLRYEDNFDSLTNITVTVTPQTRSPSPTTVHRSSSWHKWITYWGSRLMPAAQKLRLQGGFDPNVVATANILESSTPVIGGKQYYNISVLTRTADGDEGGKHQLITAAVQDGKLYICKVQAGDKRWFKGARKFVESTANSFNLA
ncbi:hypothetical protein HPP92_015688 [Vanilla planifolia]|uniref:23 kDa subunit of oxygen evolving system of photosystem II n=1 Tax=Vanilla planifolia TaxID=51239 RepID=A0A835UW19_VANPL|nr:hypothetical protein HPP92_015688 [Vanilla planifolia]